MDRQTLRSKLAPSFAVNNYIKFASFIVASGGGVTNTQAEPSFTVWDIPNDSFSGHKASKTLFYGAPNYTSTPIKGE